jgi:sugar phosphate permease
LAQTSYSAIWFGVAVMAPALRRAYGLSLGETGLLISASLVGSVVSLIPWGLASDRVGERIVLVTGLTGCGGFLLAAAAAHGFWALALSLAAAGALGASVQSASGRAVMHWFDRSERGVALGIRQTAIPISGFLAAVVLPPIVRAGGVGWGFAALGIACFAGAAVGGLVLREGPPRAEAATAVGPAPLRVLAVMQLLAVAGRIGAGRWSDVRASRVGPLRAIALTTAALVGLTAALVAAPLVVLVPVLVAAGAVSMSWNSLSFAAAVELAGHDRSGSAIGLQQTVLNVPGAAYPGLFGAFVAVTSWRAGYAVVALFPLAGWRVLRALTR